LAEKKRRDGYWRLYHLAHTLELESIVGEIVAVVKEVEPPVQVRKTKRGRKSIHSWSKLVCICLLMIILSLSFRDMQSMVPKLNLPWQDEPDPDHVTIWRAYHKIPQNYLEDMLDRVADRCVNASGWKQGLLASDSTGVETDRYEEVVRPHRKKKGFELVRQLLYLKYHIIAILDHLIILKARITGYRCADSPILRSMLKDFKVLPGCVFNADRGYDGELNYQRLYELLMHPNIKQRKVQKEPKGEGRKRLRYRSKAYKEFDKDAYHYRGMIEAIFGAEESDEHNLRTRFRIKEHREKWGVPLAIGWNLKVLNRLLCAKQLGINVTPLIHK
jgi:hypothetical protein